MDEKKETDKEKRERTCIEREMVRKTTLQLIEECKITTSKEVFKKLNESRVSSFTLTQVAIYMDHNFKDWKIVRDNRFKDVSSSKREIAYADTYENIKYETKKERESIKSGFKPKDLPHGGKLREWIIKKHKERAEPLDAYDLKKVYKNEFGRNPDPLELVNDYRRLIKGQAFVAVGRKTLYVNGYRA